MSRGATAAAERQRKERFPQDYCTADPRCLWRVRKPGGRVTPCQKHPVRRQYGVGSVACQCGAIVNVLSHREGDVVLCADCVQQEIEQ